MTQLSPYFVVDGLELPNTFANRAIWCRYAFKRNPELSQVCPDGLVWMQYEDGIWYSINGNYSGYSPLEKIQINAQREAETIQQVETAGEIYKRWCYEVKIRQEVLKRDSNTCQICFGKKSSKLHVHHILKRKDGGTDHLDNLLTVCSGCHKRADTELYDPRWLPNCDEVANG